MAEVAFVTDPLVRDFTGQLLRQSKSTDRLYTGFLWTYFKNVVRPLGLTLSEWLAKVREESESRDVKVRTKWARTLESYLTSYVNEETGKPYTLKSRKVAVQAIRKFLYDNIGRKVLEDYNFKLQTSEERVAAEKSKDEFVPISVDEFKKLVIGAECTRDKAILLSLASGLGTGEWLQFAHEWYKYADSIRNLKVPIRVSVVRPKNRQHYRVRLWDDAVQYLYNLLLERERELGHPLGPNDHLFVSHYGDPITGHRVQKMVRVTADTLGLEHREKGKIIYKFRPAEIGRDFFRTMCENAGVSDKVAEYSLGHRIDALEYNKFQNTPEGQARIEKELAKIRPLVNVISGKGTTAVPTEEITKLEGVVNAQIAEAEAVKATIDQLNKDVANLRDAFRTGNVETIQKAISEQSDQAKKRLSGSGTTRFTNGTFDYLKTDLTSQDFDQAIITGWEIVLQSPDGKVLLRKPKSQVSLDTTDKVGVGT